MEVDPDWPPLPPPGKRNHLDANTPWLPLIPMHHALGECDTAYPMLPKGCHRSRVDNTVHMGAAAKAAQWNEALGVVLLRSMMQPSDWGFPQMVADWESLLKAIRKEGSNRALQLVKAFVTQAQRQALREWTYPAWYTPAPCKGKECMGPSTIGRSAVASPGRPSGSAMDLAATGAAAPSLPLFPDLPPPHEDGWQPRHVEEVQLGMPRLRDVPERWVMWIDQHPDKRPRGIVVMPDSHVSMYSIRGMQIVKWCQSRPEAAK